MFDDDDIEIEFSVLAWFSRRLGLRMPAADVIRENDRFCDAVHAAGRWDMHVVDALELAANHDPLSAAETLRHFEVYHGWLRSSAVLEDRRTSVESDLREVEGL